MPPPVCVLHVPHAQWQTGLTCHGGCDAEEKDPGSSVTWLYLAIASSWPSPSALSDSLSVVVLLHAQTNRHTNTTLKNTRS